MRSLALVLLCAFVALHFCGSALTLHCKFAALTHGILLPTFVVLHFLFCAVFFCYSLVPQLFVVLHVLALHCLVLHFVFSALFTVLRFDCHASFIAPPCFCLHFVVLQYAVLHLFGVLHSMDLHFFVLHSCCFALLCCSAVFFGGSAAQRQ